MKNVTTSNMTDESWTLHKYISKSFSFGSNERKDIPDGRLFGPRNSSKDILIRGIPEGILEGIIEFTYQYKRPPTETELVASCSHNIPHSSCTECNINNAYNKLCHHQWTSPNGLFNILETITYQELDRLTLSQINYIRVSEKAIQYAIQWRDELYRVTVDNSKNCKIHLGKLSKTKEFYKSKLKELLKINNNYRPRY